jgi:DNA polymerase
MLRVTLPRIGTYEAWRDHARAFLAEGIRPEDILWHRGGSEEDLFARPAPPPRTVPRITVPKDFVALARLAIHHGDPERFARLYALLCAVDTDRRLLDDRGDTRVAQLNRLAKEVGRDRHKMHAFVRFRDLGAEGPRRRFAAWFEPSHPILELAAPFFAKRFGDMDWSIFTPDMTAHFEDGDLTYTDPAPRPDLPEDAAEDLWRTYFRSIFNPARLKPKAMQAEMPRKYWHNMPEAALIPDLIATAQSRAREMAEAAPTLAPTRAGKVAARVARAQEALTASQDRLQAALDACTRCPLHANATQAVPGEGPVGAPLMFVGEQPGDREDLEGRPFVGPAGQLFDRALATAGIDRDTAYVTNAVKHFKFTPRGKRRLHQAPNAGEIAHCRWWLDLERERVRPDLVVALGATALESLTGDRRNLLGRRGRFEQTRDGAPLFVTIHPSFILRLPDPVRKAEEEARFIDDLRRLRPHAAA